MALKASSPEPISANREILDSSLKAVDVSLTTNDLRGVGYVLPIVVPLSIRVGEPYISTVEDLMRRYSSTPLSATRLFGVMRSCDRWVKTSERLVAEEILQSLARTGVYSPKVLEFLARAEDQLSRELVSQSLDF